MRKNPIAMLIVVLLGAVIFVLPVSAQADIIVFPISFRYYEADVTDSIAIRWSWVSAAPGLARIFGDSGYVDYTLIDADGNVVWSLSRDEADLYWSEMWSRPDESLNIMCPSGKVYGYSWYMELGSLDAGIYTLITNLGTTKPVNDGFHTCTYLDGTPYAPPPSLFWGAIGGPYYVTIEVNEAP
jgi:hypothetical protein